MIRFAFLCSLFLLLQYGNLQAQNDKNDKLQSAVDTVGPSEIVSAEQTETYKKIMAARAERLQELYEKNRSGELGFYTDPLTFWKECLAYGYVRFKCRPADLQEYIENQSLLIDLFKKRNLNDENRRQILRLTRALSYLHDAVIRVLDQQGKEVIYAVNRSATEVQVELTPVSAQTGQILSDAKVYLFTSRWLIRCGCDNCTQAFESCDINEIKPDGSFFEIAGSGLKTVFADAYHVFVTQRQNGFEKIVFYHRQNIKASDGGKKITLRVN